MIHLIILLFIPLVVFAEVNKPITLTWFASGDDGDIGQATYYDIRYFNDSITEFNWDSTIIIPSPSPYISGTSETLVVNLPKGVWYIALKTGDEVPNWSEISNMVVCTVGIDSPINVVWK